VWRVQEGYFNGTPRAIAQTTDGYLWMGTESGLLRFDGSQFVPWTSPVGEHLPSVQILSLLAAHDGSLWIGTRNGMARLLKQKLTTFPTFHDSVFAILEDPSEHIWFSRDGDVPRSPICEVLGEAIRCPNESDGVSLTKCCNGPLTIDRSGTFWIGTDTSLIRWKPGNLEHRFLITNASDGLDGVNALISSADGSLLVGSDWTEYGDGLERFIDGIRKPLVAPGLNGANLRVLQILRDREGGLWVGTANQGIYHIQGSHVDRFAMHDGLSSDLVLYLFEDHEGNIWVATSKGLDCFHRLAVTSFSSREGLNEDNVVSVVTSPDDKVWLANSSSLKSIKNGRISSIRSGKGLPGHEVTSLFVDRAGQLWVGVDNDLFLYKRARFYRVTRSDGASTRFIVGMTEDTQNNIWAEVSGSKRELIRIRNLKVIEEFPEETIPSARPLAADPQDGIWLGLRSGDLARLRDGHLSSFHFAHDINSETTVRQVIVSPDGSVFGTTAFGLVGVKGGKSQTLTSRNGLPCNGMIGAVWDAYANLWLFTECGLMRIKSGDVQKWWADPNAVVSPRLFDAFDGVQPGIPDYNPAARSSDGRLWFANQFLLQTIDPAHLVENKTPPPVHVEKVIADRNAYLPVENLHLPPLMRDLEIDYTGLSFVNPREVKFRYQLEGRNAVWEDAGTRRQAFYTDLRPGRYRFHVIACNNDGVWNEQGAFLDFIVAPAWYQMLWFRSVSVLLALGLAAFLIFFDRRRHATLLRVRFDERLEERTRLARDLHDTLLQTIQGSKLVADHAREDLNDAKRIRYALEHLSEWLDRAVIEGRAALDSLRKPATAIEDLSLALRRFAESCVPNSMSPAFTVSGVARPLDPVAFSEVFRIGEEAIRNACVHSGGEALTVEVCYDKDLILRVRDSGRGFDPKLLNSGKPGHFGIIGMRERATNLGGRISLEISEGRGTCLTLTVPGKVIFKSATIGSLFRTTKIRRSRSVP
jgi:ligand-binding sensor domain-containing protein/signal transduction histidine kinase